MTPLLALTAVSVERGGRRVLDAVDLALTPGDRVALLGPNGAGKSTLLKAAMGLVACGGGVALSGVPLRDLPSAARARALAYVPQHSALAAPLAVRDVVAQGRFAHREGRVDGRRDARAIGDAMAWVDVGELAERPFTELSYGERRRVLLARALATEAPVILLDEPTAALDVGHALALFAVLTRLAEAGRAVLVVLHQLQEALSFAQRAVLLSEGRVLAAGAVDQVIAPAPVRRAYGVELLPHAAYGYALRPLQPGEPR